MFLKSEVFWDLKLCWLVSNYRRNIVVSSFSGSRNLRFPSGVINRSFQLSEYRFVQSVRVALLHARCTP